METNQTRTSEPKKKLTDNELIIEMNRLWASGERGKTNFYGLLRTSFKLEKQRCIRMYDTIEQEASKLKLNAQADTMYANEVEVAKEGLKSKSERLLLLQNQVDELKLEIANNKMHFHSFADGQIVTGTRSMNSLERAKISEVIKSIQAEISKIEGDYAPMKQDVTTKGESLNSEELEKQRFEQLLNAAREGTRKD